jgi:exoribonuclease R
MPPDDLAHAARQARAREAYEGRLAAMERDGQILTNRKGELCIVAKLDLVVGIVQGHPDGFGFLVPEDGADDLFLGRARCTRCSMAIAPWPAFPGSTGADGAKARSSKC